MDQARPRLAETSAVLCVRQAVRAWLAAYSADGVVAVGLSGGPDSLALLAATVAEGADVLALVVDHQLQRNSCAVAATAAEHARRLGARAEVLTVEVGSDGGLEAAARAARYEALGRARDGRPVLLGHTLDDQAETVLLGLARGSGPRSIWGMRPYDDPWGRPLLAVRRASTRQVCADIGVVPYDDPHNTSPEFTRVRVRNEVMPLLDDVLGGGVAEALARTADQLRDDGDVLDNRASELFGTFLARAGAVDSIAGEPPGLRRRVIRLWLLSAGVNSVSSAQLEAIDRLVVQWHGQGGVAVGKHSSGARLVATRKRGNLTLGPDH